MKKKDRVFTLRVSNATLELIEKTRREKKLPNMSETIRYLIRTASEQSISQVIQDELEYLMVGEAGLDFQVRADATRERLHSVKLMNAVQNYEQIKYDMQSSDGASVLEKYENAYSGKPAIVLGSGASLDKSLPLLKDWKGLIFGGPTQAKYCEEMGVKIDFLLSFDPWRDSKRSMGPHKHTYNYKLITHACIDPFLLSNWKSERYYYQIAVPALPFQLDNATMTWKEFIDKYKPPPDVHVKHYFKDSYILFHQDILRRLYGDWNPEMRGGLRPNMYSVGCTPNQCVVIAHWMGCEPIFLVGVDNCYLAGKGSALRYSWDDEKGWISGRSPLPEYIRVSDQKLPTSAEFISYKIALMSVMIQKTEWGSSPQMMLCAEDGEFGILSDVLECLPTHEVVERQGKGYEDLFLTQEEWLTSVNAYMVSRGYRKFQVRDLS